MPHSRWVERTGVLFHHRRQLGLQIGLEGVDLVMIIQNDKGMQQIACEQVSTGRRCLGGSRTRRTPCFGDTNWKLETEILTYSRAKGAFAGLTLSGASVRQDDDSMQAIYGRNVTTRSVLLGQVAIPASAESFLKAVRGAKAQAVAEAKKE